MKDNFQEMLYKEQLKIDTLSKLIFNIKTCIEKNYITGLDKNILLSISDKIEEENNNNQQKVNQL